MPLLQLGAWEGPLDLLLELARAGRIDLARLSAVELVEQATAAALDALGEGRATLGEAAGWTVMAASQTTELLEGLIVHPSRMQATLDAAGPAAEQQSMADLAGGEPAGAYLGVTEQLIDEALARAADHLAAAR